MDFTELIHIHLFSNFRIVFNLIHANNNTMSIMCLTRNLLQSIFGSCFLTIPNRISNPYTQSFVNYLATLRGRWTP